jgi:hypothetical protein
MFHFTDPDGDELVIEPVIRHGRPAISLRNTRADGQGAAAVHVPADQVEDLIAGIRDICRQATAQEETTGTWTPDPPIGCLP